MPPQGTKFDTIRLDPRGSVCGVWLALPQKLNALDLRMREELRRTMEILGESEEVRVIVLIGEGDNFCAGGDIRSMEGIEPGAGRRRVRRVGRLVRKMREIPQPIIAAVDGVATGAGLGLALASDLIVASNRARFAVGQTRIGLVPDMALMRTLPLRIGWSRAMEMMLTGKFVDAQTALEWGLINRIVPSEKLIEEAFAWAEQVAQAPPLVLSMIKEAMERFPMELTGALDMEAALQAIAFSTEDFQEGRKAFLEKRKPVFKGR